VTVDEHDDRTVAGVVVGEVDGIHGADVNGAVGVLPREQADPSFMLVACDLHGDGMGGPERYRRD
jgi:hypothetical protein